MSFDNLPYQSPLPLPEENEYVATTLRLSKEVALNSRCVLDVPYGQDFQQKLDIYLPDSEKDSDLPVLLFVHGGGFTHGYKEMMGFMAPPITNLPAVFVSIGYRLAPESRYPMQLNDCLAALEWVHNNIEDFGGSRNRLFMGGHSAGGHLTSLVTLRQDLLLDRKLPPDVVKACFPVSGIFDIRRENHAIVSLIDYYHEYFLENIKDDIEASPVSHVAGNRTPFFITYGSSDMPLMIQNAEAMIAFLKKQPGLVKYHVFKEFDHLKMNLDQRRSENLWVQTIRKWMTEEKG